MEYKKFQILSERQLDSFLRFTLTAARIPLLEKECSSTWDASFKTKVA